MVHDRHTDDVLIVGAGLAGLCVAHTLATMGIAASIVEAGPKRPDMEIDGPAWRFAATRAALAWPRVHGVGGRGHAWGGWLSRFDDEVFARDGWPYGTAQLEHDYACVERWLGAKPRPLLPAHRAVGRALSQPTRPKLAATATRHIIDPSHRNVAGRLHTGCVALHVEDAGRGGARLWVRQSDGRTRALGAKSLVLAASAIESTRVLLASGVGDAAPMVGRGLVDHPSVLHVLLAPQRGRAMSGDRGESYLTLNTAAGRFVVEIAGPQPARTLDPGLRAQMGLDDDEAEGLEATFLSAFGQPNVTVKGRVELDATQRDALGRPTPLISLPPTSHDDALAQAMIDATAIAAEALSPGVGELVLIRDPASQRLLFHEAGTCAMGREASSPCDPWGRVRSLPNVWVADAAATPSAGDRYPTLTLLAHARRVAASVARRMTRGWAAPEAAAWAC